MPREYYPTTIHVRCVCGYRFYMRSATAIEVKNCWKCGRPYTMHLPGPTVTQDGKPYHNFEFIGENRDKR